MELIVQPIASQMYILLFQALVILKIFLDTPIEFHFNIKHPIIEFNIGAGGKLVGCEMRFKNQFSIVTRERAENSEKNWTDTGKFNYEP